MALREILVALGVEIDKNAEARATASMDKMVSAAKALGAIFLTGAVAKGFGHLVDLASNAAETSSQMDQVFGSMSQAVKDFAAKAAEEVGRSEFTLREFIATTGAMVKPIVGSEKAAAEISETFSTLAVDLASFFNANEPDALRALQSGLIGSTEPLRRFGIVMTQATLDAFALEHGMGKTTKNMNQAELATLRYQFIMEKTRDAQGDAARTAGGYANATRRLKSLLKDLGTRIGQLLIPRSEAFLALQNKLLKSTIDWFKANENLIRGGLDRFSAILSSVVSGIGTLITFFGKIAAEMSGTEKAITGIGAGLVILIALFGVAILPVVALKAAILAVIATIALLIDDFRAMGAGGQSVTGTLIQGFIDLKNQMGSWSAAVIEIFRNTIDFWIIDIKRLDRWLNDVLPDWAIRFLVPERTQRGPSRPTGALNVPSPTQNRNTTNVNVNVDASGNANPQEVANKTAESVRKVLEADRRQAVNDLRPGAAGVTP